MGQVSWEHINEFIVGMQKPAGFFVANNASFPVVKSERF